MIDSRVRTRFRAALAANVLVLTLCAFISGNPTWAESSKPDSDKAPIKIGYLVPLSGVAAPGGQDMVDGFNLYLDKIHHKMAGRPVELVVESDESSPATAILKINKMVQQDHVQMLSGFLLSSVAIKSMPAAEKTQLPVIDALAGYDDLTQRTPSHWVVRTSFSSSQLTLPFGEWVYKKLGYKRIVTFGNDFNYCWEVVGGFQKTYEEAGGKIVQKIWAPLGFKDFTPYIKQIRKDADAVFVATAIGANEIFPKQYKQFGPNLPVIGVGGSYDEPVLETAGDDAIGTVTSFCSAAGEDSPENRSFVDAYKSTHKGAIPGLYAEHGYVAAMWINQAVEAVHGNVEDKEKFLAALKAVELKDSPRGAMKLDEYGNPIQNIFVRRVDKVHGHLRNTLVFTFPKVSQFWKYDPQEYMKQPTYSKDFPPCKFCSP